MVVSDCDLAGLIRMSPGDFAVYQLKDGALRTLYAAPGLPEISGMDEAEYRALTADNALSIVLEGDRPGVLEDMMRQMTCGGEQGYTYRILHKTRGFCWVRAKVRNVGTRDDCPVLVVNFSNVSSEAEEQERLIDFSKSMVYVIDQKTWEILYANQAASAAGNFCGMTCYAHFCGRTSPCPWCSIPHMTGDALHEDAVYNPLTKKWFRVDCRRVSWYGRPSVAVDALDITSQRKRQENLEIDRESMEQIVSNIPAGIGVCQIRDGIPVHFTANSYVYQMLGSTSVHMAGRAPDTMERIHPEDRERVSQSMMRLMRPDVSLSLPFRFRREGESEYRWLRMEIRTVLVDGVVNVFSCLLDISAEKRTEAELRKSRRIYESAVQTADLTVWRYDLSDHRMSVMDSGEGKKTFICGIPRTVEGMPEALLPWIEERDAEKFLSMCRQIEEGAASACCEVWFSSRNGMEPRCEHMVYTAAPEESGSRTAYGIWQDVTTRKLEEEKFRRLYRQLMEINPQSLGTFQLNLTRNWCGDGQSIYPPVLALQNSDTVDEFFVNFSRYLADDGTRSQFFARFERERLLRLFRSGQSQLSMVFPLRTSQGVQLWGEGFLNMAQNPATGDVEAVTYTLDITEKRKSQQIIRCVTDERCDFIGLIDPAARTFEYCNRNRWISGPPLGKKLDYDAGIAHDAANLVAPEDRALFTEQNDLRMLCATLNREGESVFTFWQTQNGKRQRKQLQFSWLDDRKQEILVIQSDVTTAYEQEQKQLCRVREALRDAERANRAKSDFISRISHDIRTPMNVITSMTRFAFEDIGQPERLRNDLEKIQSSGTFLMSLINDILDISKIDSGKVELHPEPYPYAEYIGNLRNMFEPLCADRGIRLEILDPPQTVTVVTDRIRLNQITLNLMSNAIKFTPPGGTVTYSTESYVKPDGRMRCRITVRDTGVGMSEEFQQKMFEPFTQEYPSGRPLLRERGTGLGLSIVKRLVELMGGTIQVDSAPGKGTTVTLNFLFPVTEEECTAPADAAPESHTLSGRVLMAEDHPVNAEIARRFLYQLGLEADLAENGAQAVEMFQSNPPGTYRAVLLDIQMPVMDGYAAARAIRGLSRPDAHSIPIVAMSADAYSDAVKRCLAAGMNGHIAKPLDPKEILHTLERLL